jgi:hypothetical protein
MNPSNGEEDLKLRGALNRGFNVALGIIVAALLCLGLYIGYVLGSSTAKIALMNFLVVFPLGALAGLPGFVLNQKALAELRHELDGKLFLSSQLALLDSRHGRNAVAYFYFLAYLVVAAYPSLPATWGSAAVCFGNGLYLSANVLPFIFVPKG